MFPNLYTREFGLCKTCLSSETPDKALAAMANRVWHSWSHWSKAMASWTPRSDFWHSVSRVQWYRLGERQTNLSSGAFRICGKLVHVSIHLKRTGLPTCARILQSAWKQDLGSPAPMRWMQWIRSVILYDQLIISVLTFYHIISYHIISHHICLSYFIISYHIISYHITSYLLIIFYHIISYHIISYHIISAYHILSDQIRSWYSIILYYILPWFMGFLGRQTSRTSCFQLCVSKENWPELKKNPTDADGKVIEAERKWSMPLSGPWRHGSIKAGWASMRDFK